MTRRRPWLSHYDPGVPADIHAPEGLLGDRVGEAARRWPDRVALTYYEYDLTYAELATQVNAFGRALFAKGLRPGERVMLALPNIPQAVIAFYGALEAGAVVALCDPLSPADDIAYKVRDCSPRFIVTIRPVLPALLEAGVPAAQVVVTRMRDYLPTMRGAFVSLFDRRGAMTAARAADLLWMRDLIQDALSQATEVGRAEVSSPAPSPEAVAVLAYTSGTSMRPRAVMLTHRGVIANTEQTRLLLTDAEEGREVVLAAVPLSHSFGLSFMNLGLSLGARLLLVPRFKSSDVLSLIGRHRPTIFPGVPAMYVSLVNHPRVKTYALGSIRACVSGGTPLPVEVREAFERLTKGRVIEGYGLTEAGPVTHANPFNAPRPASIGVPLPSTDARVVDPSSGAEREVGEIGELEVRGPQLMAGYWNRDDETRQAFRDGWLRTGDLATMDADGYFQVLGRACDVIRIDGHDVYPRDVEEVLFEHPRIREAAVTGVFSDGGVVLRAHVVPRYGERLRATEVIEFCAGRLSPWKVPTLVKIEKALPRTSAGKVQRRLL